MHERRHQSPCRRLRPFPAGAVRWTQGFWANRFDLCRTVMLSSMREALEDPENAAVLANFRAAAGLSQGGHRGTDWSDGDCYKWLEAAAYVYGVTLDDNLDRQMDELIEVIGRAQDGDGYISTQIQLTDRERWQDPHHHELYNMGHLMTAACVHHRVTGKETFLVIGRKVGDYLYATFGPRPVGLAHFCFNPSNIMGALDLYRATGEQKYLELAGIFVDMRGSAPGGGDLNQDNIPLREETEAVGHAVAAMYLWCGATDVYAETGDQALLAALERLWRNVNERKLYLTGGVGALHCGVSSRSHPVHEAFGLDYQLPNGSAYNETCANIANAMWNRRMLELNGEAKYADAMELVLYNSMLSGMSLDGKRFCYTNPLRRLAGAPLLSNDMSERWSRHSCYCCPPQVLRTLAGLHEWAYSLSHGSLWVHLYGGSVVEAELGDSGGLRLRQDTEYPWGDSVRIVVERAPKGQFAMMLRVPSWATGAGLRVNGEPADAAPGPGTYARLEREWRTGDEIQLALPMKARPMTAHPMVEETRNQVAVMRGPIVYCLESTDLPAGVRLEDVHMPREVELTVRHDTQLLGGVTTLEAEALHCSSADWEGKLYREAHAMRGERILIRMIPYYAWGNRGLSEMTVWLPAW